MAKVKFSALISEMRNKLNGSVFSRNRGGAYLRNKVTPTNPRTAAQVAQRNLLTSFSQLWRALTQVQRDAWLAAVSSWARTDVFGDVVNPSGSTLYIRLNINVALAGGTPLVVPPNQVGAAALSDLSVTADVSSSAVDVVFDPDPVPVGHVLVIEATAQLSAGISNANNKFRVIQTEIAAAASPADVFASYTAKFGALSAGKKIFVRAKFINKTTGEVSQALVSSVIVQA
jgi:hypothetical protein